MSTEQDSTLVAPKTEEELLLLKTPEEPEGFVSFWQETYALALSMKCVWHIQREIWSP